MDQVNVTGHKTPPKANSVLGEVTLSFLSDLHWLLGKHCHQVPVTVLTDVDLTSPLFLQLPVVHSLLFFISSPPLHHLLAHLPHTTGILDQEEGNAFSLHGSDCFVALAPAGAPWEAAAPTERRWQQRCHLPSRHWEQLESNPPSTTGLLCEHRLNTCRIFVFASLWGLQTKAISSRF